MRIGKKDLIRAPLSVKQIIFDVFRRIATVINNDGAAVYLSVTGLKEIGAQTLSPGHQGDKLIAVSVQYSLVLFGNGSSHADIILE